MKPRELAGAWKEEENTEFRLDWLLCFDPWVMERYERERSAERLLSLHHLIYVGLILYNAYNFTAIFLTPDILPVAVALRVLVVTPTSLLLLWIVGRVGLRTREWIVMAGITTALAVPVFLFWFTQAPLGSYMFGELPLILVYGNMLLLRFPQAIAFTTGAFVLSAAAALTKIGLPSGLQAAFVLQTLTACVWTLYANYRSEAVRGRAYLEELRATLRSEASEATSNHFFDLSLTDALTTLPNRRSLDATASRWTNEGASLAIMMIDVDHFKMFNDALGHPAGDECLRSIATALLSVTENTGHFIARFGGEEFTVMARNLDPLGAARLGKALIEAVESLGIAHPSRSDGFGMATISVGIALNQVDTDLQTVFKLADAALYEAKRSGRNRYVLADSVDKRRRAAIPP